jgi:hypothetical protein
MYTTVLLLHSWIRWAALVAGIGSVLALLKDGDAATKRAERWVFALMMSLDVQLLLGLLLYFALSPFTAEAMRDFAAAMRNPPLRFWAVEHITMMLAAVILVHVGRVLVRKDANADSRRLKLLVCVGLATLAMLGGMPWPGMTSGRPLFRL